MTSPGQHNWTPVWAMPNVSLSEPINSQFVALVECRDDRLREVATRHPVVTNFLNRFQDEFGSRIWPAVLMYRDDAPPTIRTSDALAAFRDAVAVSAITSSHSRSLTWRRLTGIQFSDAFDVYPWALGNDWSENLYAFTPAMSGIHQVTKLRAQSAPALGTRMLGQSELDEPLLIELLNRWHTFYGTGEDTVGNRRLFRALDMARAASRRPGGADSTFYDAGRAVALWVSAFEILAHNGRSDLSKVIALLNRAPWERKTLPTMDRFVIHGFRRNKIDTNTAGEVYNKLYGVRNDFLHGNPVTPESLRLSHCQKHILRFAAPLFRMALTSYLDLRFRDEIPDFKADPEDLGLFISARIDFASPQRQAEEAILIADAAPREDPEC